MVVCLCLTVANATFHQQYEFFFVVKVKKGGVETGHVFACKSAAIKKKWMKMLQINIDALNDKKAGPPAPTPRSAATMVRLGQQAPGAPTPTSASVVR